MPENEQGKQVSETGSRTATPGSWYSSYAVNDSSKSTVGLGPSTSEDKRVTDKATRLTARQVSAALVQGSLLCLFLCYFRIEKALVLRLSLSLGDSFSLILPEVGAVLVLEAVLLAAAWALPGRWGRGVWWLIFSLIHLGSYSGAVAEHTLFLYTGIRLNLQLLDYAWANLGMLCGLLAFGVDATLGSRFLVAALFLALGMMLQRRWGAIGSSKSDFRGPVTVATLGILGLAFLFSPQTLQINHSDLATSTLGQLLSSPGDPEEAARYAKPFRMAPEEIYQRPTIRIQSDSQPESQESSVSRLNIVLVILESTRADSVAPYSPQETWSNTPRLAQLARESWVFDPVYGSVTHTSKALVAILCGMTPRLQMPIYETLEGNLPLGCLPHLLEDGGYRTAFLQTALGKFENRPGLVRNLGFQQAAFQETLSSQGFSSTGYLGMDEMAMVEPARQWITEGGPKPFFLTLLTVSPHHPYQVPGQPLASQDELASSYIAALRHQDAFVGKILDVLEQAGILETTAFIVLGDHGEAFGEHRRMQHDIVPYEEVVRVPLMVRAPQLLGAPRRVAGLRHHLDLMPTVLELAHLPWQGTLPGRSLVSGPGHERTFSSCWFTDTCLTLRQGDLKYNYHFDLRPTEVFDLAADPEEIHNLAGAMDEEEIRRAEGRMLGWKLDLDEFWRRHPPLTGPRLWWNQAAAEN